MLFRSAENVVSLWPPIESTLMCYKQDFLIHTTDVGYLNRNNQRNMGRTQAEGTDHMQYLYTMRCENCDHEYFANGSDIFQKKCPKSLHQRFGFWNNSLFNFGFEGADGMAKMLSMMDALRTDAPASLGGKAVAVVEDYKTGASLDVKTGEKTALNYPSSNVIILILENRDKVIIRPSGTEPKIKIYTMTQGRDEAQADAQTEIYKKDIMKVLGIGE